MVDYVELLTERKSDVHEQLVNARKVLDDNNIAIEKPIEAAPEVTVKTRSISLVSSLPTVRRVSYSQEERSKSVTEREILEHDNEVRKKSKKCSMFATISELSDKEYNIHNEIKEAGNQDIWRNRKKSSKKVSIAENLNCDYSDSNVSDHEIDDVDIATKSEQELIRNEFFDKNESVPLKVYEMFQDMLHRLCNILYNPVNIVIYGIIFIIFLLSP